MIDKFKFRCTKVLPLVFDEALSYYEVLCKLTEKINDCIDKINEINPDEITAELEEINEAVGVLQEDVADIKEAIESIEAEQKKNVQMIITDNVNVGTSGSGVVLPEGFNPTEDAIISIKFKCLGQDDEEHTSISVPAQYYITFEDNDHCNIHFYFSNVSDSIGCQISCVKSDNVWTCTGGWDVI